MDSKKLREHTVFLEQRFRDDVKDLCKQKDADINVIVRLLSGMEDYDDIRNEESWMQVVNSTGIPVDKIGKFLAPVHYVAAVSAQEECSIQEVIEALQKENLLPKDVDARALLSRATTLGTPIRTLRMKKASIVAPNVPLLHIKNAYYRIVTVSEFDTEYDAKEDEITQYEPHVKRLYPRITLELQFYEDHQGVIGIVLTDHAAEVLIGKLQAARRQIGATRSVLPQELVGKTESAS